MQNKLHVCCLALGLSVKIAAQTLPGYITLQNENGKPAHPAFVSSVGAAPTSTDSKGIFLLIYDQKKPGQDVELKVEMPDYEVVNTEALRTRLPDTSVIEPPLRLFMCRKGEWQRRRDEYYETNRRYVSDRFAQKIKTTERNLKNAGVATRILTDSITRLHLQRDTALARLRFYAERMARTKLDDVSERHRKAFRYFEKGKIDSFLLVVNEKDIQTDLDRIEKELERGKALGRLGREKIIAGMEARRRIIEEFLIRARALVLNGQWEEADHTFDIAAREDSLNRQVLSEYYAFKRNRLQGQQALSLGKRLLGMAVTPADSAYWLYEMGRCCQLIMNPDLALVCFERSAAINQRIIKTFPWFLIQLAEVTDRIANIYWAKGDYTTAQRLYDQSLSQLERCARIWKPAAILVPEKMINTAKVFMLHEDFLKAEATLLRAGELMSKAADTSSSQYKDWRDLYRMNLANVYHNTNRADKTVELLQSLVSQLKIKAARDPGRYLWEYISMITQLGASLSLNMEWQQAAFNLLLADSLFEQHGAQLYAFGEILRPDIKQSLGMLYSYTNQYQKAEKYLLEGANLWQDLFQKDTLVYGEHLANIYGSLLTVYMVSDPMKYDNILKKQIEILRLLAQRQPQKYRLPLASAMVQAGSYYFSRANNEKAAQLFAEAEALDTTLSSRSFVDKLNYYCTKGEMALANGEEVKAEWYFGKAKDLLRVRLDTDSSYTAKVAASSTMLRLGKYYGRNNPVLGESLLKQALPLKRMEAAGERHFAIKAALADNLLQLGLVTSSQGRQEEASAYLEESLSIYDTLCANLPQNQQLLTMRSKVLNVLGNAYFLQKKPEIALQKQILAVQGFKEVAALSEDPEPFIKMSIFFQLDVALARIVLNDLAGAESDLATAQIMLDSALSAPEDYIGMLALKAQMIGLAYLEKHKPQKARRYFLQSLSIYEAIPHPIPMNAIGKFNALLGVVSSDTETFRKMHDKEISREAKRFLRMAKLQYAMLPQGLPIRSGLLEQIKDAEDRLEKVLKQ